MKFLDQSSIISITTQDDGSRIVHGVFNGVEVTQCLPQQSDEGIWVFDNSIYSFMFIVIPNAENLYLSSM